nr:hypothetical protein [Tanacetum cinerariifolium]
MALPNKVQLKFHSYQDAKLLMEAIEKRYEGNKESKKVQRTLLKQQYENFTASSLETLDQTFDRLQKLINQFEIQELEGSSREQSSKESRKQMKRGREYGRETVPVGNPTENALIDKDGIGGQPNSPQLAREDLEQIDPDDLEEGFTLGDGHADN